MIRSRELLQLALVLAGAAAGWELTHRAVLQPVVVAGPSMGPWLAAGDLVVVDTWSYGRRLPRPGEIVLCAGPDSVGTLLVKRVGRHPQAVDPSPIEVGPTLWVEGAPGASSWDSRAFGPIPANRVLGRVVLRYWPLRAFGRVE